MSVSSAPAALAAIAVIFGACGSAAAQTGEGEGFTFKPRGRIQVDAQHRDWDVRDEDDTDLYVRRLYLGAQGRLHGDWRYKIDLVLTPGIETVGVDDAYIEYAGEGWSLFVGEHNVAAPLEERTSSLDIPFIERSSIINAFGYGRRAGLGFTTSGARWQLALAAQGGSMNAADGEGDADESRALSARFSFAPILDAQNGRVLHLGANVRHRYQNDASMRVRARPLNGRDTRWIDAGSSSANRLEDDVSLGGEIAFGHGPFTLVSEYIALSGDTPAGGARDFHGYYIDAHWSLTGEARPYRVSQGVFTAVSPRAPLNEGGMGHWALSARHDFIDLSDGSDVNRGEQSAYALGLDWIPVEHVRFKLNYAHSEMDRTIGADDEAEIITLRGQFDF